MPAILPPGAPRKDLMQGLNHRHEGIIKWLIANPSRKLGECAAELGFTPAYLSIIIHSDTFRAAIAEAHIEAFGTVCLDLKDKLTGLSHLALDKLIDSIPVMVDPGDLLDTAKLTLNALGYGGGGRAP